MPALVKRLTPAGLADVNYIAENLRDAARHEPCDGVYTVSNTYNSTQTLLLGAHLDRLEDSALREGISLQLDRNCLRRALRQMIVHSGYGDARFRISVPANAPDELLLTIEPFQPPAPHAIIEGVRCITTAAVARSNPASKSSMWMHQRESLLSAMPAGIYETFLVDSRGAILEGLTSNFYAVNNSQLLTAGDGVLAGISRKIVLEVCIGILPLRWHAPRLEDLPLFNEAFLTSSSRGIIPVVEIDGVAIGDGKVGLFTRKLRTAYDRWVADHLEEL